MKGPTHCLVVSEEVGARKPDSRIFEIALERLGAKPEQAVLVGDWKLDALGARSALLARGVAQPVWRTVSRAGDRR